jgi:hypothetical protein
MPCGEAPAESLTRGLFYYHKLEVTNIMGEQDKPANPGAVPAGNTQPNPPPASGDNTATPANPITFTQEQLEREVEKRLAADRTQYGRDKKTLDEREKTIKSREDAANAVQHEIDCFNIARDNKLKPEDLKAAADELGLASKEQIAALAKRLGGTTGTGASFTPDSGRTTGGGIDTSKYSSGQFFEKGLEQLRKK